MRNALVLTLGMALLAPGAALAADTATCNGKRAWQRDLVRDAVHAWFQGDPDADHLVNLVQAEHGVVACASRAGAPGHLHTRSLPRGLQLDQLGAILLANELEWRGLIAAPEEGLAGEFFHVVPRTRPADAYARPGDAFGAERPVRSYDRSRATDAYDLQDPGPRR